MLGLPLYAFRSKNLGYTDPTSTPPLDGRGAAAHELSNNKKSQKRSRADAMFSPTHYCTL